MGRVVIRCNFGWRLLNILFVMRGGRPCILPSRNFHYLCLPQALLFFRQLLLRCSNSGLSGHSILSVARRQKTVGTVLHDDVAQRAKAIDDFNTWLYALPHPLKST